MCNYFIKVWDLRVPLSTRGELSAGKSFESYSELPPVEMGMEGYGVLY